MARPPPVVAAETVPYAVAIQDAGGVRVVLPTPGSGSAELPVPGSDPPVPACPGDLAQPGENNQCPGPCHETAVGVEPGAFAIARTQGDVAWVAYGVTRRDDTISYHFDCAEAFCTCFQTIDEDHTTIELVVTRVPLLGDAGQEILRVPGDALDWFNVSDQIVHIVDLAAAGDDLLLAARLRDAQRSKVRALRIAPITTDF